ncbi:MAG TPA: DUF2171 domain-containing protein [Sphingobium sp.]|uniref:DUF2171 domain-containing protein n=1 Tax=Sphingobium sp. TaxID=1912891 RepID=UPI002ED5F4B9
MFERLRLKEHMEVADANGRHLGTIDEVEGDAIKLTRSDSDDGQHHYIPFDSIDRIDDNRVYLTADAPAPAPRVAEQSQQADTQQPFNSGHEINPNEYSSHRPTLPNSGGPLFGTSGHGTGVGGSGVGH